MRNAKVERMVGFSLPLFSFLNEVNDAGTFGRLPEMRW